MSKNQKGNYSAIPLCDICHKEPARIRIGGKDDFCLKCHNEMMLQKQGRENTFDYAETIAIWETSGEMHTFKIEHVILGAIVSWDAYEQGGEYHFREISDIDENGAAVAARFFQKIADGVRTKSLESHSIPYDIAPYLDDNYQSLRQKGSIRIVESGKDVHEAAFEIDGKVFTGQELAYFLNGYSGFTLQYQIHDASDPVLKEDEYLVPVYITKESLVNDLHSIINAIGDQGFISYKQVFVFDEALDPIIKKLEVLAVSEKRDDAVEAGKEMIRMLRELETDDDIFPVFEVHNIIAIIDPFGLDDELNTDNWDW